MTTIPFEAAEIALNKLIAWKENVRKTDVAEGIEELAASIAAHGLLHPLIVKKSKKDRYETVAGQRRLLALAALVEQGRIEKSEPIPCRIVAASANATEISLAENLHKPMHPADQFEAFSKLVDKGSSITDIAARFGISETTVRKRLALARVSPNLMKLYREGQIDLAELAAFTVTDDHAEQEQVWNEMPRWDRNASGIRRALLKQDVPATDKRVRLVTLAAYEAAGGAVKRDLFSDEQEGTFLLDTALLDRLAREKLEIEAANLHAEGWKWVECRLEFDYEARAQFRRLQPTRVTPTAEQNEEIDGLVAEFEALETVEDEDDSYCRQQELERRFYALQHHYADEQRTASGAIVTITRDGKIEIERGLVNPLDDQGDDTVTTAQEANAKEPTIPASLTERLTAQKTAIIAAELTNNPHVALAGVVYTLALPVVAANRIRYSTGSSLQVTATRPNLKHAEGCGALHALENSRAKWLRLMPAGDAALWQWCLAQTQDVLLDLLAFCAACSVNAIQQPHEAEGSQRLRHADAVAAALSVNIPGWFKPTAENYFGKVSKRFILAAYEEATGKPAPSNWHALKKAQLAAVAERELAETGWLPAALRIGRVMDDQAEDAHSVSQEEEEAA